MGAIGPATSDPTQSIRTADGEKAANPNTSMSGFSLVSALEPFAECPPIPGSALCGPDERTEQDTLATKPYKTSRIARLAGLVITVVGMAVATASWASITSSENPSTDGSYTISWSAVPNASSHQLYEDGTLVYDSTGTSRSFSGKAAGDYEYTVGFCEYIFDEEMCYGSGYTALTVTVSSAPPPAPTVSASFNKSSITLGGSVRLSWSSTNATACSGSPSIGSTATSGSKTYTPSSAGSFSVTVTCTGAGGSGNATASVTVPPLPVVSASFNENSITLGDSVTLSWSSTNASACSGSPSIGSTATSGSKTYTPSSAGSFSVTVTCTGAGGSGNATASVTVPPLPVVSASFNENSITLGDSVTLSWSSTNASACSGSPSIGSTSTSGTKTYTPTSTGSFSVRVTCRGAGGSDSATATVTVKPSAPTLTVPSTDSDRRYTVSWTSVSGATSYKLDEKSGSGSFTNIYSGSGTSRNITGKADGTYSYRVRACSSTCGDWSSTATVSVEGNLTASPNPSTDGSYTVSWTAIPNAESYQLYEDGTLVYDSTGTSWSFSGKAAGSYEYTLEFCELIFDEEHCDLPSGYGSLTVTVTTPPLAPTLTVPATDADGSYTASWTAPAGATSYKLEEKPAGGSFSNVYDGANRSHEITGKTAGIYMYRVRACAGVDNCGDWSATETTKVPPGAPRLTIPATDADGTYDAAWTSPSGATSYKLQEKVGLAGWSASENLTTTTKSYTGKTPAIYMYRVRACAGSGNCGDWSSTGTTKVPPGVPTLTVPATDADGGYLVSWTSPSGATGYQLQEKSGSGSFGDVYSGSSTSTNITDKTDGTYSYQVRACAGTGNCGGWSSTKSVEVSINRAPAAVDDSARTPYQTAKVIDVLANDTDADDDVLTVTAVTTPANGTAKITSNNTRVTYTPQSGYSGADTFDYTVSDGTGSDVASVSVTINGPPEVEAEFDESVITLGDSVTLSWRSSNTSGCGGMPSIDSTATEGTKTYTPSSAGTFEVTVTCTGPGTSGSASDAASVTVNTPPVAVDDTARTAFETAIVIEVLANDSDADGDDLTVTAVTMPTNGTAAITADADGDNALVTYTPQGMYSGADTFRYTVSDGTDTASAAVSVTVNTPPTVLDDTAHTAFETAIVIEVLANDSDADGDDLTVTVATTPTNGTATITADADGDNTLVTYTPQSGYSGADTFDYTVSDGTDTGTGTVSVTVDSATPPRPMVTASFDQSSITLGESVTLTWSSTNASQCSGMPSIDSMATSGTKMYTPSITGSFSVTVTCTGAGGSDNDTASVTVTPASTTNTPPVAADDTAETPFDTAVEIAVLANDTDADGDDLTVAAVTAPANGTAMITSDADGNDTQVTYAPGSGYSGEAAFDYTVSDGADTDTGSVRVTVNLVKVTPNPSTTGSYTLSWLGTIPTDRYLVLESVPGGESLSSFHSTTSVDYTGKATGEYTYDVFRCQTSPGPGEICEEYGRAKARVILPITPGNLPYRSGVTKGGDAYVNVPIAPVPGVNGLAPRLSIDYSGGRERHRADQELPADMIGYGWRVGGFSTIRRCVKGTADSDGISFDDTDALCLDGEPLTKISRTDQEGDVEYRTSRESFAKVLLKDNTGGHDWFEVHLPDGTVREYGSTADSQLWKPERVESGTEPAEPAAPFLWSINKQTDAFGNVMKYKYYEDRELLARHPKKITYGAAEDATIEFVYKPRDDLDSTQVGSFFLSQPQRLTYIHLRLGGSLVRDYRLAYKRTSAGQVRLNELQTCGYEPSGTYHCLSPLEIGWLDAAGGTWVSQLTDPMGAATTFVIETLKETDAHDFVLGTDETPFGATSLPANTRALPAQDDGDVKPVVTSVTRSDGIGGTRRTSYAYLGRGVENTRNWGFLGFHAIRETDSTSGIVTYTQYRLDYPYFGRPAQVVRYEGKYVSPTSARRAKTPLSKRSVRYAEKSVSHTPSTVTTTLPHAEETMEWLYEGTSTLGAVRTTETLTLDAGLVDQVVRETRTGHGPTGAGDDGSDWGDGESHTLTVVQRTTQRTLSFDNDETDWVLGFVDDIDVKHYSGDSGATNATPDWTETVGRTRVAGTLAPDVVTRFPGGDLQHKTDYRYDMSGNRDQASETEGMPPEGMPPDTEGESSDTADDSARTWEVLGFAGSRFPTSWRNPLNHRERATHHVGLGVPATTTDANNRRTSYAYDGLGRETSRTRHWDSVEITNEDGTKTTEDVKTTTTYAPCDDANACDAVEATVADCGTRYSVAPVMKVTTTASDMPDTTAHLDMFGRAIRTSVEGFGGADRRVDAFHDARGRTACESEPYHAGETALYTRYAYDIRDRLTRAARPDGGATGIMYAAASNGVTATVTETVKAANGNQVLATRQTKRTHNVLGELVSTTEGAAEAASKQVTTRYAYDGAGRLKTVTTGDQTTTFAYDAAGNRASVENPNLGATLSAGDGTVSVKFEYNGHGELTERTDARGATYHLYDKLGRRTCAADRGGAATWEYDPANGTGLLKRRGYDRDTILTDPASCAFGGDFAETYAYNTDARLATVTTAIVNDQDPATTTTLTRGHAYDDYGRLSSTTYPSAVTVEHEYNNHGYPWKLKHGETELVKVTAQTARGQSAAERYGNGVRTRRHYDELGRLSDIDTIRRGAKIQDNTYAWRSDGSLQRRTARAGSGVRRERFAYDYLNRLTGATTHLGDSSTASRTLTFRYDLHGNLEFKTGDVTGYDYDPDLGTNRLREAMIGDVAREFPHDTSGHIERYACKDPDDTDQNDPCAGVEDTFIDWNARGLAEKVTVGDSKTDATPTARDSFRYGPDGARYFKKSEWAVTSGATTTMKTSRKYYAGAYEKTATVGGDTVERVRIGDSVVHVKTTPAGMMPTAESVFEYVHRDHLGSVEAVTDEDGAELVVLGHDPYGERRKPDWTGQLTKAEIETLLGAHGERVSRGFTRHEHLDRTGLIHMNGRMYDPRLGRFLSPDPIVGDPTSSRSWNLYSYARNNPLSYVDPTGESAQPIEEILVTAPRCDWVCGEDIYYWLDWWDASHGWWNSSSWGYGDSYSLAESMRADATNALKALDKSVADQPMDDRWTSSDFDALLASIMVTYDDTGALLNEVLEKIGMKYNPKHGFAAALYKINGHYYLAKRGTQGGSLRNWWSNLLQALGFPSSQYKQAVALTQAVSRAVGGNLTLVGHSKGGGLASAGSFATGLRAITFNAAGLHSRYRTGTPGEIRAHYIRGDPLSVVQDFVPFLPEAAGTRIEHPFQYTGPFWKRHSYQAFPFYR